MSNAAKHLPARERSIILPVFTGRVAVVLALVWAAFSGDGAVILKIYVPWYCCLNLSEPLATLVLLNENFRNGDKKTGELKSTAVAEKRRGHNLSWAYFSFNILMFAFLISG